MSSGTFLHRRDATCQLAGDSSTASVLIAYGGSWDGACETHLGSGSAPNRFSCSSSWADGVATNAFTLLSQPWRSTADVNRLPVLGTLSVCLETYMAIAVSGPAFALNIRAPPFLLEQLLESLNLTI